LNLIILNRRRIGQRSPFLLKKLYICKQLKQYRKRYEKQRNQHPEKQFLVTPIGCGIASFDPEGIAPLFKEAKEIKNITSPKVSGR